MAIKALMLRKKIDLRQKSLDELLKKEEGFQTRESELAKALEEASNDEEVNAVEEEMTAFQKDKDDFTAEKKSLEDELAALKAELVEEEKEQEVAPAPEAVPVPEEVPEERKAKVNLTMDKRNVFAKMSMQERAAIFEKEDVKNFLEETRSAMRQKRAITNIGLTIPEVFLGILRENIMDYSKLYGRVTVRRLSGTGRMLVMSGLQEAIWTECCANLNEMSMTFADLSVDCYKVGGYYAVCNANLSDSDINLASEILTAIGTGIGYALDKAILYGKNTSTNNKMPLGVVSRLAQTAAPSDYPATAPTWVDLHSTNLFNITAANSTGIKLFQGLVGGRNVIHNDFARGNVTWIMNDKTYTILLQEAMAVNASGAIVSGVNGTMPVIGGDIVVLDFIPDNDIIFGYFDLYLLAERAGQQFAESEHVRFLQDQTVWKGTARYDGLPMVPKAFAAVKIASANAPTATMTFAADTANQGE